MKKVCLILILALFTLGSSGFSVNDQEGQDCDDFANQKYNNHLANNPGDYEGANMAYFGYYWACMDTGGFSMYEVSLN
jgi:hypothetical protein